MSKLDFSPKLKTLQTAKTNLKSKFIGIDPIIDQIFDCIHIWYLMPELLMRPIIINLWGMTGVGKTDLIRSLAKELGMEEKFLEVELSSEGRSYGWESTVGDTFTSRGLEQGKQNIVLFDEIQKFRSIDDKGEEIKVANYQDFWELLSDGKISDKGKGKELLDIFYDAQNTKQNKEDAEQKKEEYIDSKIGIWQASRLKKYVKTSLTVIEIAQMTYSKFAEFLEDYFQEESIYDHTDYSQTLIIISGNIDEAFADAKSVGEVEVDADIFHNSTSKVNLLNIKESLSKRFRPEQISRFGNIHIIYPSLSKADYHKLITFKISQVCQKVKDKLQITVEVDPTINDLIYNNGVFPTQGVRPVFSSITEILECNLSKMIFEAVLSDSDTIKISYDILNKAIVAKITKKSKSKTVTIPYIGRIDKIKLTENTNNLKALTAVHECGHAIIYILNFGLAPLQLKSNIASTSSYGFTFSHKIHLTKELILRKIQVYLAGNIAEKLIFGDDKASTGNLTDWKEATLLAGEFIRKYGFGDKSSSVITTPYNNEADKLNSDINISNTEIEDIFGAQLQLVHNLLSSNIKLLTSLSKTLLAESFLTPTQIQKECQKFGIDCAVESENFTYYEPYSKILEAK
jgi:Peptidase family M41/C-terminal, D2-small domain, of ClpB protein/ATPase family associated with various cellular activities (AAA)